jgi:hypothetical protein
MDEISVGIEARKILESTAFQQAVQQAEENVLLRWRTGKTVEERELAHAHAVALAEVIQELEVLVGRGEVAEHRR